MSVASPHSMGGLLSRSAVAPLPLTDCDAFVCAECDGSCGLRHNAALRLLVQQRIVPNAAAYCSDAACPGCALRHGTSRRVSLTPPPASLIVCWDVDNANPRQRSPGELALPPSARQPSPINAGDVARALLDVVALLSGGRPESMRSGVCSSLVAVHHSRESLPLRASLRAAGVRMLDAGTKLGAVDIALKGVFNDVVVEHVLGRLGHSCAPSPQSPLPPADQQEHGQLSPPPLQRRLRGGDSWVWLVSGDRDFADDCRRARRVGLRVGIVYTAAASPDLLSHADASVPWAAILNIAALYPAAAFLHSRQRVPATPDAPAIAGAVPSSVGAPPTTAELPPAGAASINGSTAAALGKTVCRHFLRGKCRHGDACSFMHVLDSDGAPPTAEGGDAAVKRPTPRRRRRRGSGTSSMASDVTVPGVAASSGSRSNVPLSSNPSSGDLVVTTTVHSPPVVAAPCATAAAS